MPGFFPSHKLAKSSDHLTMAPAKGKGGNSKAEEARQRKEDAKAEKALKEQKEKEDAAWADEGKKSKAAQKKVEAAEKKAEAAAKRAEAKKLAEQEEKELEKVSKKAGTSKSTKVTAAELAVIKEKEQSQLAAAAAAAKKRESRMAEEQEYVRLVDVENTNRMETLVDARSLDSALSQMSVTEESTPDRHPERRLKASYKAFEEAELARLKSERPGMTLTQYKDIIWKAWKKSPLNPMNQTL